MLDQAKINRRRLIQGAGAAGVGLAGLGTSLARPEFGALAQDTVTLQLYHDKSPWQDLFVAMSDMSESAIGIGIEPTAYGDTTSYQAALLPALPTDDAPDIFTWWSGFRMEDIYKQNVLADVSDVWTAAVAAGDLPESLGNSFAFDGKQYALPTTVSYWVTFYNMKTFADNNVTVPTTWDELTAAAETFKAAGVTPFAASVHDRWPAFIWFQEMLIRTDPVFYDKLTAGEAKYTDETAVQAMTTWKDLIDKGYFTDFDIDLFADAPNQFAANELAMIPIGTWYPGYAINPTGLVAGTDYGIFIMPKINPEIAENTLIVETGAMCLAANAQHIDDSKKWATWWTTPDAQTAWANKLGDSPANPQATSDNPEIAKLLTTINDGAYRLQQRYWEASPVPIVEGAVDYLAEFMLDTSKLNNVLGEIQTLADTEWAKRQ